MLDFFIICAGLFLVFCAVVYGVFYWATDGGKILSLDDAIRRGTLEGIAAAFTQVLQQKGFKVEFYVDQKGDIQRRNI